MPRRALIKLCKVEFTEEPKVAMDAASDATVSPRLSVRVYHYL